MEMFVALGEAAEATSPLCSCRLPFTPFTYTHFPTLYIYLKSLPHSSGVDTLPLVAMTGPSVSCHTYIPLVTYVTPLIGFKIPYPAAST
jgi:hypothetical protein